MRKSIFIDKSKNRDNRDNRSKDSRGNWNRDNRDNRSRDSRGNWNRDNRDNRDNRNNRDNRDNRNNRDNRDNRNKDYKYKFDKPKAPEKPKPIFTGKKTYQIEDILTKSDFYRLPPDEIGHFRFDFWTSNNFVEKHTFFKHKNQNLFNKVDYHLNTDYLITYIKAKKNFVYRGCKTFDKASYIYSYTNAFDNEYEKETDIGEWKFFDFNFVRFYPLYRINIKDMVPQNYFKIYFKEKAAASYSKRLILPEHMDLIDRLVKFAKTPVKKTYKNFYYFYGYLVNYYHSTLQANYFLKRLIKIGSIINFIKFYPNTFDVFFTFLLVKIWGYLFLVKEPNKKIHNLLDLFFSVTNNEIFSKYMEDIKSLFNKNLIKINDINDIFSEKQKSGEIETFNLENNIFYKIYKNSFQTNNDKRVFQYNSNRIFNESCKMYNSVFYKNKSYFEFYSLPEQ